QKIFNALAGGKFFLFVLFCNPFFAAPFFCFGNDFLQFFIVVGHIIIYFFSVLSVPLWLIFHHRDTEDTEVYFGNRSFSESFKYCFNAKSAATFASSSFIAFKFSSE